MQQYIKHEYLFFDAYNEYIKKCDKINKLNSNYNKRKLFEKHILPMFENIPINKVDKRYIVNFKNYLFNNDSLSDRTKHNIFVALSSFLNYCEKEEFILFNPCKKVDGIRYKKKQMKYIKSEEFNPFIEKIDNINYYTLFVVLYMTGARKGEILARKWTDYDRKRKTLNITTSAEFVPKKGFVIDNPKNDQSIRLVQLDDNTCYILNQYYEYKSKMPGFNKNNFIFTNESGKIFPLETIRRNYKKYLSNINKDMRIHDLRHSHVAYLIKENVDLGDIGERIGHINKTTTINIYGHWDVSKQQKIAENLSNLEIKEFSGSSIK